jgi:hypothetical protein
LSPAAVNVITAGSEDAWAADNAPGLDEASDLSLNAALIVLATLYSPTGIEQALGLSELASSFFVSFAAVAVAPTRHQITTVKVQTERSEIRHR